MDIARATATATATAYTFATLVARQRPAVIDVDEADSTTSTKTTKSRISRTASSAESATSKAAKTAQAAVYHKNWFEENPATTIAATAFGMTIVLFGLLAVYCYLKYRNDQAKLALENAEVETGRIAIEEKQRAISSESGDGTYPHFGASKVPLKQSTTLDEQYGSYQSDGDLSGSYSLDDIPEEMEEEEGHKKAVALNSKYVHNEDEEEDLRSSQMHERPTSSQHARSNNSDKDLPLEPADAGQPDAGKAPHPSPASGMSKFGAASSDEDPRLARSALKTLHKSHTSPNPIADIDTRDSVYSIQDKTKYA